MIDYIFSYSLLSGIRFINKSFLLIVFEQTSSVQLLVLSFRINPLHLEVKINNKYFRLGLEMCILGFFGGFYLLLDESLTICKILSTWFGVLQVTRTRNQPFALTSRPEIISLSLYFFYYYLPLFGCTAYISFLLMWAEKNAVYRFFFLIFIGSS